MLAELHTQDLIVVNAGIPDAGGERSGFHVQRQVWIGKAGSPGCCQTWLTIRVGPKPGPARYTALTSYRQGFYGATEAQLVAVLAQNQIWAGDRVPGLGLDIPAVAEYLASIDREADSVCVDPVCDALDRAVTSCIAQLHYAAAKRSSKHR